MWFFVKNLLRLGIMLWIDYLQRKSDDRHFEADMKVFQEMVNAAVTKMRLELAQDSDQAGNMDDVMDEAIRRNKENS